MKKTIHLKSNSETIALYGSLDEHLRFAEAEFNVRTSARNQELIIEGKKVNVQRAAKFFEDSLRQIRSGDKQHGKTARGDQAESHDPNASHFLHKGKMIKAKSKNQEDYIAAVHHSDVVLAIGPAGTGKTYLAMALAIDALKQRKVERIVLTRPAVEAGESLGFLPGDLAAKINPYLRPLYDALYDMMDYEEAVRHIQRGTIEVAPLAYMRGRTLGHAFVILDEAQNCTYEQFKMFVTRLGLSSKMIITGDITQIDLPSGKRSGLVEAQRILKDVEGIQIAYLNETDVVRHRLVQDIIKAYDKHERKV